MAKRSIQGYVELASGLGEMTKGAAKDAAAELVSLTNADLSRKKVTKQASKLADDLVAAANTNRKNLVSLVRAEVDKAVGRLDVASIQQELSSVTDTVQALRGQVEELASSISGRSTKVAAGAATSAATLVDSAGDAARDTASAATTSAAPRRRPARSALKKSATKAPAKKSAPAKKTPAKATAKKASPAKKVSTAKAAAPAKKAAAKKSTTVRKAPAKKAPAKKVSTAKAAAPAKKATTVKKATPAKTTSTPTTPSVGGA